MRRYWILPASLILALVAACGSSTAPAAEGALRVEAEPGQVVVENTGLAVIRFVVVNPQALVQLTGPEDWPTLTPGASAITANKAIIGWSPGATHAAVYWSRGGEEQEPIEVTLQ